MAVLRELKSRDSAIEIRFWCDRKFGPQARSIVGHFDETIKVETIFSGKLRRYNNLPLWRQLLRPVTIVFPNIRDGFLVVCGFVQSIFKLLVWRPDVVFTKGGFVCLPVGLAAKWLNIPLVIHDSDAHPGLTNRILAKWATSIATGAPLKHYPYPKELSKYVGIPINPDFAPKTKTQREAIKKKLGFDEARPLVVITGGGLGARRLNDAIAAELRALLLLTSVLLISGVDQFNELKAITPQADKRFQLHEFISSGMADLLGAADIVIARAGATTILELAALGKPTILVPNGFLTGGHQLKNAAAYEEVGAVLVIDEHELDSDPTIITKEIRVLLNDPNKLKQLSENILACAKPNAASDMADMIISAAKEA